MKLFFRPALALCIAVFAHSAFAQEEADAEVREALESGVIATRAQRARIHLQNEKWEELAAHARKWTREFPGESEAWAYLGRAHRAQNEPQAAADAFLRAWELSDKNNFRIIESVGDAFAEIKEWERAEAAYREAISLRRRRAELWAKLADVLFLRRGEGWREKAAEALKTALSFGQYVNDPVRWRRYAEVLDALGADAARRYAAYRHVVRLDVKDAASWEKLYDIEKERGKTEETEKIARILRRIDPQNPTANLHYGLQALDEGRTESAVESLHIALERGELSGPRRSRIYTALGDAHPRPAEALPFYRDAASSDPSNLAAWEQMVVMLRGLNRRREAQTVYEQLLAVERKIQNGGAIVPADAAVLREIE